MPARHLTASSLELELSLEERENREGKKEYAWSNLSVVRGWGGTKATSHLQAATIKTLGFNNPIIKNGLVVERTNDLKNGSENKILENKIGNGNGETAMIINGGDVIQNNTNINSHCKLLICILSFNFCCE